MSVISAIPWLHRYQVAVLISLCYRVMHILMRITVVIALLRAHVVSSSFDVHHDRGLHTYGTVMRAPTVFVRCEYRIFIHANQNRFRIFVATSYDVPCDTVIFRWTENEMSRLKPTKYSCDLSSMNSHGESFLIPPCRSDRLNRCSELQPFVLAGDYFNFNFHHF